MILPKKLVLYVAIVVWCDKSRWPPMRAYTASALASLLLLAPLGRKLAKGRRHRRQERPNKAEHRQCGKKGFFFVCRLQPKKGKRPKKLGERRVEKEEERVGRWAKNDLMKELGKKAIFVREKCNWRTRNNRWREKKGHFLQDLGFYSLSR